MATRKAGKGRTTVPWRIDQFKSAIRGNAAKGIPGLRSMVEGFGADDGYDLRRIDEWTPAKKRKVREVYGKIRQLEGQEKRIVRPRNKTNLAKLQDAFHGDIKIKGLRVALIPDTEPQRLPGAKKHPPKIKYTKGGITINRGNFARTFFPFDKQALAKDGAREIKRVFAQFGPEAKLFYVQTGEYQTLNGKNPEAISRDIQKLMLRYDGKTALPFKRGRKDNRPKMHHWKLWLNGIYGFTFDKKIRLETLNKAIVEGIKAARERKEFRDNAMSAKKPKRRGK